MNVLSQYVKETQGFVICSVHQPRSQIFNAFRRLHLLSQGRTVYHGPLEEAVSTIEKMSGVKLPLQTNPADVSGAHPLDEGRTGMWTRVKM